MTTKIAGAKSTSVSSVFVNAADTKIRGCLLAGSLLNINDTESRLKIDKT
jgi:hypothetical protein